MPRTFKVTNCDLEQSEKSTASVNRMSCREADDPVAMRQVEWVHTLALASPNK